jgi:hypothetical protein
VVWKSWSLGFCQANPTCRASSAMGVRGIPAKN